MDQPTLKRKVAVKLTSQTTTISRPVSPFKTQSTNSSTINTITTTTNGTPIKARAKVNSSAIPNAKQKQIRATTPVNIARSTGTASTQPRTNDGQSRSRPHSPVKSPPSSSSAQPKIRSSLSATPSIPQLRTRAQTASAYDLRSSTPDSLRLNNNASSLHHVSSYASLQPGATRTSSRRGSPPLSEIDGRGSPAPKVKIKAKVSGLAKHPSESLPPTSPGGPAYSSTRISGHMRRTPSTSSAVSGLSLASSPPPLASHTPARTSHGPGPVFYPITSATPAANPHRYSPAWSPPFNNYNYPPRERHDTTFPRANANGMGIRIVDPTTIPLPDNSSPPASAVSLSSRSSVSRSSLSYTTDFLDSASSVNTAQTNGNDHGRSSINTLVRFHEMDMDDASHSGDSSVDFDPEDEINEEKKVRAAAKSNRKIADLEITNRSLLVINSTLESAKHRQAKEIRELKRKLRESRLILPPRTFKVVKSSLDHDDTAEDEEASDDNDGEDEEGQEGDETYRRVKMLLEGLLETGKKALEQKPADFIGKGCGGAKVLHADELKDDGNGDNVAADQDNYLDADDDLASFMLASQATIQPQEVSNPGNGFEEAMSWEKGSSKSQPPTPPPIVVTHT